MFFFLCVIHPLPSLMVWTVLFMLHGSVLVFSADLEWRSNVINSDSFDNPVGHKNPR